MFSRNPNLSALWILAGALASSSAGVHAAEVVLDPPLGGNELLVSRPITYPIPGYSLSQSFRAEDSRIRFGFRLVDINFEPSKPLPNAGATITYRLYAGENSYDELLATRHIAMPSEVSDDAIRAPWGDVGFVEADFSAVPLAIGEQYTMQVTMQPANSQFPVNVWLSWNDPYPHGRFYFPPGIDPSTPDYWLFDNANFANEDLLFRMAPAQATPSAMVTALRHWIVNSANVGDKERRLLLNKLHRVLLVPDRPAYQRVACQQLDSFIKFVDQHADSFDDATAVFLFDQAEQIKLAVPCS